MASVIDRAALAVSFAHAVVHVDAIVIAVDGGRHQSCGPRRHDRWRRPAGIEAMCVCDDYRAAIGYSGEELRDLSARIERQAELQREFQRLADGVGAALLKDRHRLGDAVLIFYSLLGTDLRARHATKKRHMRPYYEDMRRAYMKNRKPRRKTAPKPAEP